MNSFLFQNCVHTSQQPFELLIQHQSGKWERGEEAAWVPHSQVTVKIYVTVQEYYGKIYFTQLIKVQE